jgi:DNA modification methylase/predicted nucleic acid-binding protein
VSFYTNLLVKVADLTPYSNNARQHSPEQVAQIIASINEFGFTSPILIDETNTLIAGHGRLAAARQLGMVELPALVITGLTEAQRAALRIADNKLALNASWDDDLLRTELMDLRDVGFDLGLTGFGEAELAGLFADMNPGLTDPDDVPEAPAEPVTQPGDVWLLGRHRLVCGDCTDAGVVETALDGVKPHLMVTDPPYGVDFDPTWRKGSEQRTYMADRPNKETLWKEAWDLFAGEVVYIWHGSWDMPRLYQTLVDMKFDVRAQIIWNKDRFIIGRGHYCFNHEPCLYAVRKMGTAHWQGARDQPTVWTIKHQSSDTNHGAQKPVECMRRPIENSSSPGQAVYEPFCGSGTTIIAAEMTGRACHAIEISPTYCDVTILRWQAFTGQTATRTDGTPYDAAQRQAVQTDRRAAPAGVDDDRLRYPPGGPVRAAADFAADAGEAFPA